MAGIDTSIYSALLRPPKSIQDYDNEYDQQESNKLARLLQGQQMTLNQQKLDEYGRGLERQNRLQSVLGGIAPGAAEDVRINALRGAGFFDEADKIDKAWIDRRKAIAEEEAKRAETRTKYAELVKKGLGYVFNNPTPEAAMQAISIVEQQTGQDLSLYRQQVQSLRTPEQLKQWAAGHALEVEKSLPKTHDRNLGNAIQGVSVNPVTGVESVVSTAPTEAQTPFGYAKGPDGSISVDPGFLESKKAVARAGATSITNNLGQGSKGWVAADQAYGKDFVDFETQGMSDVVKQLDQLKSARKLLKSGSNISGPIMGNLPDPVLALTNPKAIQVQDAILEVGQRNLRLVLGAQFTEKEGKMLLARVFNPRMSESENVARLDRLMEQIKSAADAKMSAAKYFRENGTLYGWKGKQYTLEDFDPDNAAPKAADKASSGPKPGSVENGYRFKGGDPAIASNWEKVQ